MPACQALAFEDRLGFLVDRECHWCDGRRLEPLLRAAKLKHTESCLENVQYSAGRGIDKRVIASWGRRLDPPGPELGIDAHLNVCFESPSCKN